MRNITLSLDDRLLEAGRKYAEEHNTTLNGLIRDLLSKTVTRPPKNRMREMFKLVDELKISSQGRKWRREDAYDI